MDIHNEDDDMVYYSVKFVTGRQRETDFTSLKRNSPLQAPICNRFDEVDKSFLQPTQTSSNPVVVPPDNHHTSATSYQGPSGFDTRSFLTQFKAPLRSDDDIITFYLQLKSQGEAYNIHLIDIKDVQADSDLCPKQVSTSDRKKISLAIFQKIQYENTQDVTYTELDNIMDQFSATSDGYEALQELLRRVHLNLNDDNDEYERVKINLNVNTIFTY